MADPDMTTPREDLITALRSRRYTQIFHDLKREEKPGCFCVEDPATFAELNDAGVPFSVFAEILERNLV